MHTEAYQTYVRLREELNELISKNLGDSRAAEKVRDLMDEIWYHLSETEREEINMDEIWYHLSETEREEINKDIKLPSCFWQKVEKKLREWKFSIPSETLEICPYSTDKTLREIIEEEKSKAGDEAAIKLLGRIIGAITGAMG